MISMRKTRETLDIANGPLLKNLFAFAVPMMLSSLLQMLFNSADTIIVGKFGGDGALAAVGATGSIVFLLTSVFNGLSTGANVLISRYLGQNDFDKIRDAVHSSVVIALCGGVFLTVIGLFFSKSLLTMMSTPDDIIEKSALYMRIYFSGVIFMLFYNFGSAVLRSKGDTRRPLFFLILSGAVNVGLNLFTVIVLKWSVVGVALSTVCSQALSAFLVFYVLINEEDATRLDYRHLYAKKDMILEIMRIGIPAGLSSAVFALSNVVIQSSINSFNDTDIVAGNSAGNSIENFVYIGYTGFNAAAITFTSHCMGAKRKDRVKEIMLTVLGIVAFAAVVMGTAVSLGGPYFLTWYTDKQSVVDVGMVRILWVARFLVLNGVLDTFVNSLRGMGYSTLPTVLMILGICGIRLAWIYTMFPVYRTLKSIYLCFPVSWSITALVELGLWIYAYNKLKKEM